MTQELPHGFRERLEELFSNLRQGALHLRRLFVHKLVAKEIEAGKITARVSNIVLGDAISVDTINEYTAGVGVTVDGLLLQDGNCDGVDVSAHAARHAKGGADDLAAQTVEVTKLEATTVGPDSDLVGNGINIQTNEAIASAVRIRSYEIGGTYVNVLSAIGGIPVFAAKTGSSVTFGSPLAMGSNKITGLTAGAASGEAVEYDQLPTIPSRQLKIRLDDTDVHASNTKGFTVWEGDASTEFKYRMNSETAVGIDQVFKVYMNGAEEISITISNGTTRSAESGSSHTMSADDKVTILHTAGNTSGTRFELTGIEQ